MYKKIQKNKSEREIQTYKSSNLDYHIIRSNANLSGLEMEAIPFGRQSTLEIGMNKEPEGYKVEIDKAGVICVFYICMLPFIEC